MTRIMTGRGVCDGVVVGPVFRMGEPIATSLDDPVGEDPEFEQESIGRALEAVALELDSKAEHNGPVAASVLRMSASMARDPELCATACRFVTSGMPTAHSLFIAIEHYCDQLAAAGGRMADRSSDLRGIGNRAIALLLDQPMPGLPEPGYPYILTARELTPTDAAILNESEVIGVITEVSGPTSHTSILVKSFGLPAVAGCGDAVDLVEGTVVAMDGRLGLVEVNPSTARFADSHPSTAVRQRGLTPGATKDGHRVGLLANVGTQSDSEKAATYDPEGVGLFRTEFAFLNRHEAPTVDEEVSLYTTVFQHFRGKPITVRTLDVGADKPLPYLGRDPEANPTMGLRGLRLDASRLEQQLSAIKTAQQRTDSFLQVMAPMIATTEEAAAFAALARRFDIGQVGVMIEVPSAMLLAHEIMEFVDFVSIGTNDLSQFMFAADRLVPGLVNLLDPWQPALLRSIAQVCQSGLETGTIVSVCGESASDPIMACVYIGMGAHSLSMAPPSIAAVHDQLASLDLGTCQRAAEVALRQRTPQAAREAALYHLGAL